MTNALQLGQLRHHGTALDGKCKTSQDARATCRRKLQPVDTPYNHPPPPQKKEKESKIPVRIVDFGMLLADGRST